MKILDEKGRLFGKINIVDFLIAFAVIMSIGAIAVMLFATPIKEAVAPSVKMTSTYRIRGASTFLQAELEQSPILGERLIAGNEYVDAYIVDVKTEPYVTQITTADGQIVNAVDPVKMDYIVTVESSITANTPILKIATQEVRAGRTFILKTRYFETSAFIESVVVDD